MMAVKKTCAKCGIEKNVPDDFHIVKKTGKPRPRCKMCTNEDNTAWAKANPEKCNARTIAWRAANPGRASEIARAWQLRNPDKSKQIARKVQYSIDFDALWASQDGKCASCGGPMARIGREPNSVTVDHDRNCCPGKKSCGKCVRGLIHRNCNLVLGYAKDDLKVLRCAVDYLEKWQSRP